MKKSFTVLAWTALTFIACEQSSKFEKSDEKGASERAGGILHVNEVDPIKSLMPIAINELNGFHVAAQVYEGLVKYDQNDLSIVPALARSWDLSEDRTEYTFHLRPNVFFHDDPCFPDSAGRAVTARDVKFCFEHLCTKNKYNNQYEVTFRDRVQGAKEYYAESGSGRVRNMSGLQVIDDSTIVIRLLGPDVNFLHILTMPGCYIYPGEAFFRYGDNMQTHCVGTGPFYIDSYRPGNELLMRRHTNYWRVDKHGERLPYLDGIRWTFIGDKKSEVAAFRDGQLHMIYNIPVDLLQDAFKTEGDNKKVDFDILTTTALSSNYYAFNLQANPFFSLRDIRLAFNLAVDRRKLADYTIKGEARPAEYGMVPYTELFEKDGYNYKEIKGYVYDPDSARKLLVRAGYGKGRGLPDFTLEINSGGSQQNMMVALAIQKMLKENLGVNVNMNVVSWNEHVENVETGKSDFFRYAWVSDYADPESFLTLFYGKYVPDHYQERSHINLSRFRNSAFDSLFDLARAQTDKRSRYKLYSQAEQILLDEAAFMPLFYDENFRLVYKQVKNLPENPLNYMDMSQTYFARAGEGKKS